VRRTYNLPYDVIKHLDKQDNMSAYITRLVRSEMGGSNIEKIVKDIVKEIFDNKNTLPDERA
jgi:hypothetical protein